jgi:hypothetical protein
MSLSSQAALIHLRAIKPNDGWSIKQDKGLKLCRRNAPLTDNVFLDIHYCHKQNVVVGVLTKTATTCQVLVNSKGLPVSNRQLISCKDTYDPNSVAQNINFQKRRGNQQTTRSETEAKASLSHEQNQQIMKYALIAIVISVFMRILNSSLVILYLLGGPLTFLYAVSTCPTDFDAKKELKRVLRGHHLPEDHPEKPKGFFEDLAARVAASVTTELATLPGYELAMTPIAGAMVLVDMKVPTAQTRHYWVGAFGKWYYVYSKNTA